MKTSSFSAGSAADVTLDDKMRNPESSRSDTSKKALSSDSSLFASQQEWNLFGEQAYTSGSIWILETNNSELVL